MDPSRQPATAAPLDAPVRAPAIQALGGARHAGAGGEGGGRSCCRPFERRRLNVAEEGPPREGGRAELRDKGNSGSRRRSKNKSRVYTNLCHAPCTHHPLRLARKCGCAISFYNHQHKHGSINQKLESSCGRSQRSRQRCRPVSASIRCSRRSWLARRSS